MHIIRPTSVLGFLLILPLIRGAPWTSGDPGPGGQADDWSGGAHWGANYFPNVPLTTQDGKTVRFFDDLLKDKVVVIDFIYTSCPDVCPLETSRLTQLQGILGDHVGRDVFLYSISIDPARDTPEVLKAYAEKFQAGPGWLFLTGREDDITLLRRKLSLYRAEQEPGSKDHNVSLIIGNQRTGRWMKSGPYENPYFLANQVGSWLLNWKDPAPNQDSYANAPHLRQLSLGENLFRTRCSSCHVIGGRELVPPSESGRLLGPDLLGVTERRDKDWLKRWLATPNELLAQGDPLATELYEKHGKIAMPNLSLSPPDVDGLIEYMETESRRVQEEQCLGLAPRVARPLDSCCRKNEAAVLGPRASAPPPAPAAPVQASAPRPRLPRAVSVLSTLGLGSAFLGLAAFLGRRRQAPAA